MPKTHLRKLVAALAASAAGFGLAGACRAADDRDQGRVVSRSFAIAQYIDRRLQVVYLSGRTREFEKPDHYFIAARFSADGRAIVGHSGSDLVVLNQHFEVMWRVRAPEPNVWFLALSPSKDQVAYVTAARDGLSSLGVVVPSGENRILATFRRNTGDGSCGLGWSREGDRIVFGSEGQVKTCDISTMSCETLGDGFEPTWSPNGRWIAYRRADDRAELYDVAARTRSPLGPSPKIVSLVHWAPDSGHVMVEEKLGHPKCSECSEETRFVVYGLTDGSRKEVFDSGSLRDWYFDWISDPAVWSSSVRAPKARNATHGGRPN